jgi:hypothetical protein
MPLYDKTSALGSQPESVDDDTLGKAYGLGKDLPARCLTNPKHALSCILDRIHFSSNDGKPGCYLLAHMSHDVKSRHGNGSVTYREKMLYDPA